MLVSDSRKFVFVHVQRAAGTSVSHALLKAAPDMTFARGKHTRVAEAAPLMEEYLAKGYGSFAFVRNPWDRLVSWYSRVVVQTRKYDPRGWQKSALWAYAASNSHDFESFVLNCTDEIDDRGVMKCFAYDQMSYLCDGSGRQLVQHVGRFESLDRDFARICQAIGLKAGPLPHRHAHGGKERDYRRYYSDRTAEAVATRFKRDIEAFGYEF